MLSDLFRGPAWIIILIIVLLLFGAPRLPALARSLGQSMKIFRSEVKTRDEEPDADAVADLEADDGTESKPAKPKK
jgi:sec-independent protein translocase protein TatA